ncbi:DUF763 domain-containing protein [Oceanobacillus sp. Castelsardo]
MVIYKNERVRIRDAIIQVMVMEYGTSEVLRRLSESIWFQSFGSVT